MKQEEEKTMNLEIKNIRNNVEEEMSQKLPNKGG